MSTSKKLKKIKIKREKSPTIKIKQEKPEKQGYKKNDADHVKELSFYIDDRISLMHQVFLTIKPSKLKSMAPDCIKDLDVSEIKELCLDELLGISTKRLKSVIQGTECPTDTSSDDSEQVIEHISLDEISDDDEFGFDPVEKTTISIDDDIPNVPKNKHMTVLELLELQARARAIRSQLSLEPVKEEKSVDVDGVPKPDKTSGVSQTNKKQSGKLVAPVNTNEAQQESVPSTSKQSFNSPPDCRPKSVAEYSAPKIRPPRNYRVPSRSKSNEDQNNINDEQEAYADNKELNKNVPKDNDANQMPNGKCTTKTPREIGELSPSESDSDISEASAQTRTIAVNNESNNDNNLNSPEITQHEPDKSYKRIKLNRNFVLNTEVVSETVANDSSKASENQCIDKDLDEINLHLSDTEKELFLNENIEKDMIDKEPSTGSRRYSSSSEDCISIPNNDAPFYISSDSAHSDENVNIHGKKIKKLKHKSTPIKKNIDRSMPNTEGLKNQNDAYDKNVDKSKQRSEKNMVVSDISQEQVKVVDKQISDTEIISKEKENDENVQTRMSYEDCNIAERAALPTSSYDLSQSLKKLENTINHLENAKITRTVKQTEPIVLSDSDCDNDVEEETSEPTLIVANKETDELIESEGGDELNWKTRWLSSDKVKNVLVTSKLCSNIKKRKQQAKSNSKKILEDASNGQDEINGLAKVVDKEIQNLEVVGSVEEFTKLASEKRQEDIITSTGITDFNNPNSLLKVTQCKTGDEINYADMEASAEDRLVKDIREDKSNYNDSINDKKASESKTHKLKKSKKHSKTEKRKKIKITSSDKSRDEGIAHSTKNADPNLEMLTKGVKDDTGKDIINTDDLNYLEKALQDKANTGSTKNVDPAEIKDADKVGSVEGSLVKDKMPEDAFDSNYSSSPKKESKDKTRKVKKLKKQREAEKIKTETASNIKISDARFTEANLDMFPTLVKDDTSKGLIKTDDLSCLDKTSQCKKDQETGGSTKNADAETQETEKVGPVDDELKDKMPKETFDSNVSSSHRKKAPESKTGKVKKSNKKSKADKRKKIEIASNTTNSDGSTKIADAKTENP